MSSPAGASANASLSGARGARVSWLGRLISRTVARDLSALFVPGLEIVRARALDPRAAGLGFSPTPRHANVLVMVGQVPENLREAAAVVYAQMPRPRAVLAVGAEDVSPLPEPDVSVGLDQHELVVGVAELRRRFAKGAFGPAAGPFEPAVLRSRTEYTCPMHPEVVLDEPGTCPKCGMDLIPRETAESGDWHAGHPHQDTETWHEAAQHADGSVEHDGAPGHERHDRSHGEHGNGHDATDLGGMGHGGTGHDGEGHTQEDHGHLGHDGHGDMDHGDMGFMSMVEMTQGTPRSSDGLQMEWVETPFGPLFPGLPGGLSLTFTLDGDTVATAEAASTVAVRRREDLRGPIGDFVERFAGLDPLAPTSYRLLAMRAVESAAGVKPDDEVTLARVGELERERAASHLNWLAGFGYLIGYSWLAKRAEELQLALLRMRDEEIGDIRAEAQKLARRVERTPFLRRKLDGVGMVTDLDWASGPVARAGGRSTDARAGDDVYLSLGFEPVVVEGGDAFSRLRVRLSETERSLHFVEKAVGVSASSGIPENASVGRGEVTLETPRGAATLAVTLKNGEVAVDDLRTPSAGHMELIRPVTQQRELGDALAGVASLDLSPWEVAR